MSLPSVLISVIIASRHRPVELDLCLRALGLQDHSSLEIVVVADPAGLASAMRSGVAHKAVAFDEANISAARNLGVAATSGQILAFIDDDAVAEPSWAGRLAHALQTPGVVAVTGPVLGTNGISVQWGTVFVDTVGLDHDAPEDGRVLKLLGTNMAFRADSLRAIGGFDPAYRFFLDDADASRRIALKGSSVFVQEAVVQHGFAPSAQRRGDRVPLSLVDIGRSRAIFLRRHGAEEGREQVERELWAEQSARLTRHVAAGRIGTAKSQELMAGLAKGWAEGWGAALPNLTPLQDCRVPAVLCQSTGPRDGVVLSGRFWARRRLMARAAGLAREGLIVTVICLTPGPRAHRHRFDQAGFWTQIGGTLGWSDRRGPRIIWRRFATRIRQEIARLSTTRPVGPL
jgi:GT2 family glycosyltransferase